MLALEKLTFTFTRFQYDSSNTLTHSHACASVRAHTPPHITASAVIIQTNPLTDPSCCSLNGVQSVFWA